MRILIADDVVSRYGRFIEGLATLGCGREDIVLVPSANDARSKLEVERFDLLILDLLIPLWPETEPDAQNSLDLLFEIQEGETLFKPNHILGITTDKGIVKDAIVSFEDWTWAVIEYSAENDEWLNRSINCVRYILNEGRTISETQNDFGVDLAIVTALESPELEEVLKLPWNWQSARPLDDITFVRDGSFLLEGKSVSVCAVSANRMGMVSTALLSAKLISAMRPRLLVMCGICAGVRGKVQIGDVLVIDPAWDYQSGKRVKDELNSQFSIAPHQLPIPEKIRTHLRQLGTDQASLSKLSINYSSDRSNIPRIRIGPVASGSAVLADGEVINEIRQQQRDLIGVEMEAYGLYAAANSAARPQPITFALKGVCDFADPDKGDEDQRFAAYTSANVLRLLMESYGIRLLE